MEPTTAVLHTGRAKAMHAAAATLPAPAGTPGTTFDRDPSGANVRGVALFVTAATADVTIPAGVWLCGHHPTLGWLKVYLLDGGAAVVVTTALGRYFEVTDVLLWADALALYSSGGAWGGGGTISMSAVPMEFSGPA